MSFTHTYNPDHRLETNRPNITAFLWQRLAGGSNAFAAVNGRNQYASWTPAGTPARTLSYDGMQNLTCDGVNTYGFDLENRLLTASRSGMSAAYVYDPLGRRVSKTVDTAQTATLYDGDGEIGDYESGAWVRRYVPSGRRSAGGDPGGCRLGLAAQGPAGLGDRAHECERSLGQRDQIRSVWRKRGSLGRCRRVPVHRPAL